MTCLKRVLVSALSLSLVLTIQAQVTEGDTLLFQRDSVIELEPDPTTIFFQQGEKTRESDAGYKKP